MAYFNWEDFMRAAAGVAQGELAGRQQAQAEAMQRQQQETQGALQLQQLGAQSDEANFGPQENYLRQLETTTLPRLTGTEQTRLLQTITGEREKLSEARARAQIGRSGLLPAHLRPFFQPPPAALQQPAAPQAAAAAGPVAPAPGAVPPNWHAPSVLPESPAQPQSINLGRFGSYAVKGLTDKEIAQYFRDRTEADKAVREFQGDPALKAQLVSYLNGIPNQPADDTEFDRGYTGINAIRSLTAGNAANAQAAAEGDYKARAARIDKLMEQLRKPNTTAATGARIVRQVQGLEKDLAARYPQKFDPATEGSLLGYENQLAVLAKEPDAAKQGKAFQDIARELRDNVPPGAVSREATGIQQVLSHMSLRDQQDPKLVEKKLRVAGYARAADEVAKNGVPPPDPYHADKALQDWFSKAPAWAGMQNQDAFLYQGIALAEQAGKTPAEIRHLIPQSLNLKQKPLTAYQQRLLNEHRLDRDERIKSRQEMTLHHQMMEQKTPSKNGGSLQTQKLIELRRHAERAFRIYDKERQNSGLTEDMINKGTGPNAAALRDLRNNVTAADRAWDQQYQAFTKVNAVAGGTVGRPSQARPIAVPRPPTAAPPGPYGHVSTSELLQRKAALQRQLGRP